MKSEVGFEILRTLVAIAVALALGYVIIYLVSEEPGYAFSTLVTGPLTSVRRFGNFIEMAIPLVFTGLALSLVFQASQFNIGAEGQLFLGAVAATMVGIAFQLPPVIHVTLALAAAAAAGALGGAVPGLLKARWGANELVSSLMLNYVYYRLGIYIINYHFRDERAGAMVSLRLAESSWLHHFWPPTRLHGGLFIAIGAVLLTYVFLYHTRWGYALRMTGINASFAAYSGISVGSVIVYSQVLSGAVAGIAGGVEMLGILRRFQWQMPPGYGFDGVIVAILARNHPLLVPVAALFLAYLRTGADIMARETDMTAEMVTVIQSVMILLVTAQAFLRQYRHRAIVRASREANA
ncbi:MAG: ABC transporter permease [Bacillota bacterium]|nr:ABC transporter permease [Bacillota bacterium]REJ34328.1 MAG: ABC transporter permease [Bacillota bacterium]